MPEPDLVVNPIAEPPPVASDVDDPRSDLPEPEVLRELSSGWLVLGRVPVPVAWAADRFTMTGDREESAVDGRPAAGGTGSS